MTARVDLAEFLTAYLAETDEQLTLANGRVLAIEASHAKNESNPRAVRELFRALHTVKGLSSMVGVEPVVAIAHRMESVLRTADRAGGDLRPAALEPILEGLRAIEHRVRALADGKAVAAPPGALLAALEALEAGDLLVDPGSGATLDLEPSLSGKLAAFEKQQLLGAPAEGKRAIRLEFVPSQERAAAGQSINSVRERVSAVAEIVKVFPVSRASSDGAPSGLAFVLLLVTAATDGEVAAAAGVSVETIASVVREPRAKDPSDPLSPALLPIDDAIEAELPDVQPERKNVLRVDVSRVDEAMERVAALIVSRSRLARVVGALDAKSPEARELRQIAADIARQVRDLRAAILHVRMVRVGEVLERVPLLVRGLRRSTGKHVRLEIDPGDAELDKAVAERIFPAILHLVRNAIDHGIESPEERRATGKPDEGLLRITASARSNRQLELVISDDGRGIDRDRVAPRQEGEAPVTDAVLLDLLCRPGFSTRQEANATSGRGMGMDIVKKTVVDQLGGEMALITKPGLGTSFTLHLPLTIAIVDAFVTRCRRERFVVPVSMVEEIVEVDPACVVPTSVTLADGALLGMFERRGEAVPMLDLASVLGLARDGPGSGRGQKALVVRRGGRPVAFVLDGVLGQQEAVVRPLQDPLVNVRGVSGSTDLGDGRPTLVLDLVALAEPRSSALVVANRSGGLGLSSSAIATLLGPGTRSQEERN